MRNKTKYIYNYNVTFLTCNTCNIYNTVLPGLQFSLRVMFKLRQVPNMSPVNNAQYNKNHLAKNKSLILNNTCGFEVIL